MDSVSLNPTAESLPKEKNDAGVRASTESESASPGARDMNVSPSTANVAEADLNTPQESPNGDDVGGLGVGPAPGVAADEGTTPKAVGAPDANGAELNDLSSAEVRQIAIGEIDLTRDVRGENCAVDDLEASMAEVGLINPVLLQKVDSSERFALLAGDRRLHAARNLAWKTIPARVLAASDIDGQIAAIDENLARRNLPLPVQVRELARRKELYEAKHPATRHGGNRKTKSSRTSCDSTERFSQATARLLGVSERKVQQLVRLGEAAPEVLDALLNKEITRRTAEEIAGLPAKHQVKAVAHQRTLSDSTAATWSRAVKAVEAAVRRITKCCGALDGPPEDPTIRDALRGATAAMQVCLRQIDGDADPENSR